MCWVHLVFRLFGWLQVSSLPSVCSTQPRPSAVPSEALATVRWGHHKSSSVRGNKHQALHLASPPHLPDALLRSLLLQGAPNERQRLKRAQGARLRLTLNGPALTCFCCWGRLETEISYWLVHQGLSVDLCLLCCLAAVWGWYWRLLGDCLNAVIREAFLRSLKS